jgi:hypothetical protein
VNPAEEIQSVASTSLTRKRSEVQILYRPRVKALVRWIVVRGLVVRLITEIRSHVACHLFASDLLLVRKIRNRHSG